MPVKSEKHTRFADELRLIPRWAWVLAGLGFICIPILFVTVLSHDPKAPSFGGLVALGILAGLFMPCFFLLIVYVNRDAGRRGMNRVIWTLLAIFVPNALGIILYFLLRQPLPALCPALRRSDSVRIRLLPEVRQKSEPALQPLPARGPRG